MISRLMINLRKRAATTPAAYMYTSNDVSAVVCVPGDGKSDSMAVMNIGPVVSVMRVFKRDHDVIDSEAIDHTRVRIIH